MKIVGHVIAADDTGETIKVTIQGRKLKAAHWQPFKAMEIFIPMSPRTFHLGRSVELTIRPK